MVRLVFRPYTRLRRSICTSESLRTSTRVSPGFVLAGHRSPSFGSQHVRSRCACPDAGKPTPSQTPRGCAAAALGRRRISPQRAQRQAFAFTAPWCFEAPRLAHMLDSLVRVSRRVEWNHNRTRRKLRHAPPNDGAPARDRRRGVATGNPEDSDRIASPSAAAGAPAHREIARTSTEPVRVRNNCRRADNGAPEGLEAGRAPRNATRANLPTAAPEGATMSTDGEARPRGRTKAALLVPTGCDVLLKEPYERRRWHIGREPTAPADSGPSRRRPLPSRHPLTG